ncbi:MAG: helix-turn-helix transcriptional regulator [Lachnospiraceae bacterium]|nr:helix-turn-helix transcriptional regulator [Lachnospiraceae bacterium]
MTNAYDAIYLNKATRTVGNMLHDAVLEYGHDGEGFLQMFLQSGIAEQIENGNPKYVAGRSGAELYAEVVETVCGHETKPVVIETQSRSDVYWTGWILAYYQWHSGRSFRDILETVSYEELLGKYDTLHEADVQKTLEVLDAHMEQKESKLKTVRKHCGLTQEELSKRSGVSLNTIRAYERKAKDIGKAQVDIVARLSDTLHCEIKDIL